MGRSQRHLAAMGRLRTSTPNVPPVKADPDGYNPSWRTTRTHAIMDDVLTDHGVDQPEGWDKMTVQDKRTYIDANIAGWSDN